MKKIIIGGVISALTAAPIATVVYFHFDKSKNESNSSKQQTSASNTGAVTANSNPQTIISAIGKDSANASENSETSKTDNIGSAKGNDNSKPTSEGQTVCQEQVKEVFTMPILPLSPSKPKEVVLAEYKASIQAAADTLKNALDMLIKSDDYKYFLPESFKNINKVKEDIVALLVGTKIQLQRIETNNTTGELVFIFACLETSQEFRMPFLVKTIDQIREYIYELPILESYKGTGTLKYGYFSNTTFMNLTSSPSAILNGKQITKDQFLAEFPNSKVMQDHLLSVNIENSWYKAQEKGYFNYTKHYIGGSLTDIKYVEAYYSLNWFGVLIDKIKTDWYDE